MADRQARSLCAEERLTRLIAEIDADAQQALRSVGTLLREYPEDPRLHFLKGSLLAAGRDYPGAQTAMRKAVALAPDYTIARYQLGFLLLTCGEPYQAQEAWGPLYGLPPSNFYALFVTGLDHLIRNEFDTAIRLLSDGIERNGENAALNGDMQKIIDEIRNRRSEGEGDVTSSVDLLLQQAALKSTRH